MNITKSTLQAATDLALSLIIINFRKWVEVTMQDQNGVKVELSSQDKVNFYYTLELQHFLARLLYTEV